MAKKKNPQGLPARQFSKLKAALKAAFEKIGKQAAKAVRNVLARHARTISRCSLAQLQDLEDFTKGSYGIQIRDALRKAVCLGQGRIALHVYHNSGVTWRKLVGLRPQDLRALNDPKYVWDIATSRNKVVQATSSSLTVDQTRQVISRWPKPRALPAKQQFDPRTKPVHKYYSLVCAVPDPVVASSVLATFRLGNSEFKARVRLKDLNSLVGAFPSKRKKKIV